MLTALIDAGSPHGHIVSHCPNFTRRAASCIPTGVPLTQLPEGEFTKRLAQSAAVIYQPAHCRPDGVVSTVRTNVRIKNTRLLSHIHCWKSTRPLNLPWLWVRIWKEKLYWLVVYLRISFWHVWKCSENIVRNCRKVYKYIANFRNNCCSRFVVCTKKCWIRSAHAQTPWRNDGKCPRNGGKVILIRIYVRRGFSCPAWWKYRRECSWTTRQHANSLMSCKVEVRRHRRNHVLKVRGLLLASSLSSTPIPFPLEVGSLPLNQLGVWGAL